MLGRNEARVEVSQATHAHSDGQKFLAAPLGVDSQVGGAAEGKGGGACRGVIEAGGTRYTVRRACMRRNVYSAASMHAACRMRRGPCGVRAWRLRTSMSTPAPLQA